MGFYMLIEKETHTFILKLTEIFPWRETVLRAHGIKSDEKPFFCQIYVILFHLGGGELYML